PPLHLGEDKLRACEPGTIEDEVDRRPAAPAEKHRRLLDDLRILRPSLFETVAVDARGRRPWLARLQHQPAFKWQPHEVRQLAIRLRVAGHHEGAGVAHRATTHAAAA